MGYKGVRLALCVLGLCTAGFADTTDTMQFLSGGNNAWEGIYVSPYTAAANGNVINIFCIDYNDEVTQGQKWQANIAPFDPSATGYQNSNTLSFGFNGEVLSNDGFAVNLLPTLASDRYLEAVWLATQMESALQAGGGNMNLTLDIDQVAAWLLFVNESNETDLESRILASGDDFQDAVYKELNLATSAVDSGPVDTLGWSVVTGTSDQGPVQEFLTYTPPSQTGLNPVPEPSQIVLMVTMIALIALVVRRSAVKRRLAARQ